MVEESSFLMVPLLLIALLGSYPSVAFSILAAFSLSSFSATAISCMNRHIASLPQEGGLMLIPKSMLEG